MIPWWRCIHGHVGGVSMTAPWWCCWRKSFFQWTGPSTAPTAPGPEQAVDPERGLEALAETETDASPAPSRCREGSPARRAGTDTTLSGPFKVEGEMRHVDMHQWAPETAQWKHGQQVNVLVICISPESILLLTCSFINHGQTNKYNFHCWITRQSPD